MFLLPNSKTTRRYDAGREVAFGTNSICIVSPCEYTVCSILPANK